MQDILVEVPGSTREYTIHIGNGILNQSADLIGLDKYSKIFIITDDNVSRLWLEQFRSNLHHDSGLIVLPSGEKSKVLSNVEQVWKGLRDEECDRRSVAIMLGGGVVGDLGGFAASTYLRGIAFVHIPTTLLAQIDSSIGGKTVIDFDEIKNLVGTFAQPATIIIDPDLLSTLPERELIAGFAEMFKYGLIRDANFFYALAEKTPKEFNREELVQHISESVRIKVAIVAHDERETGDRKVVNFGHTVGHAVEALSWKREHPLLHGEAIAIGMVIEADLSQRLGYLSESDVIKISSILEHAGLPVKPPQLNIAEVLDKMKMDKKNDNGIKKFTLLKSIGDAIYDQQVDETILVDTLNKYVK